MTKDLTSEIGENANWIECLQYIRDNIPPKKYDELQIGTKVSPHDARLIVQRYSLKN